MTLTKLSATIGLSACLFSVSSLAGDLLLWQDNSATLLYGSDFNRMNFNEEENRYQSTGTLEHASGWVWGEPRCTCAADGSSAAIYSACVMNWFSYIIRST